MYIAKLFFLLLLLWKRIFPLSFYNRFILAGILNDFELCFTNQYSTGVFFSFSLQVKEKMSRAGNVVDNEFLPYG